MDSTWVQLESQILRAMPDLVALFSFWHVDACQCPCALTLCTPVGQQSGLRDSLRIQPCDNPPASGRQNDRAKRWLGRAASEANCAARKHEVLAAGVGANCAQQGRRVVVEIESAGLRTPRHSLQSPGRMVDGPATPAAASAPNSALAAGLASPQRQYTLLAKTLSELRGEGESAPHRLRSPICNATHHFGHVQSPGRASPLRFG